MTTALLALAVGAAVACPVHMLWRMRRGDRAGCLSAAESDRETRAVAERQAALAQHLAHAERHAGTGAPAQG